MYRLIDTRLWSDPKVRELQPKAKLLFVYFITNPHAHFSGIYYLPLPVIRHETGLSRLAIETGIDTLSKGYLVCFDRLSEIVWVVNMLRYQGRGKKILQGVANQLESLHKCTLISEFLRHYKHLAIPYQYPIDGASIQEQEQEEGGGRGEQEKRSIKSKQEERGGSPPPSPPGELSKKNSKNKDPSVLVDKLVEKFNADWKQPWEWWRSRLQVIQQRTWKEILLTDRDLLLLVNGQNTGKGKFKGFEAPDVLWLAIAYTKRKPKKAFPYLQAIARDQDSIHRLQKLASAMTDNDFG